MEVSLDIKKHAFESAHRIKMLVNDHLEKYSHPALFLSGGVDSRLLAAAVSDENKNKTITVSFGMKNNDESSIATEVAKSLNIRHLDLELSVNHFIDFAQSCIYICEGQDLFAQGYLLHVCDVLRRELDIDAILDGMEIGVSLGSDFLKEEYRFIAEENLDTFLIDRFYIHKDPPDEIFLTDPREVIHNLLGDTRSKISDIKEVFSKIDNVFIENYTREVMRLRHRIIRKSLPDIMMISDWRYLELVSNTPLNIKNGRTFEMQILHALNPHMLDVRNHNTLMPLVVPKELSRVSKENLRKQEELSQVIWQRHNINVPFNHYFTNFSEWFRSNPKMKEFVSDYLLTNDCRVIKQFIREDWLKRIVNEHFLGIRDHRSSISYVLSVEMFLRSFNL